MNTSFDRQKGNDEWLTPKYITDDLGPFDLDPCSPINRPWDTANKHYTVEDDGLVQEWKGHFIFCNPPYGTETFKWIKKLSEHDGIALIFARTDTKGFHSEIFDKADAILFIKGRLRFCTVEGVQAQAAGAPSCLVAYGEEAVKRLERSTIKGRLVMLK